MDEARQRAAEAGLTAEDGNGGPQTNEDLNAELLQEVLGSGPSSLNPDDNGMDWFQVVTLLKSVGHSLHDIEEMGLAEWRGYMSAALWRRNLDASTALNIATLSSSAAASGDESLFEHISQYHEELKTAHKNV